MQKSKKLLYGILSLILLIVVIWVVYFFVHFYSYNKYRDYVSSYDYEEGSEFTPISESTSDVDGMVLAAENNNLKLYINETVGEVAFYDKRNGETFYSNPVNAEEDSIAN